MSQHQQHCFRAFCVIANSWQLISSPDHLMSGTTDVMQRVLSHHLSSVPYQFSIIEDVGGWQPCNHTILEIITWFKTMWPMTKWIDKTKMPHHRPGTVFPRFPFLFTNMLKDVAASFLIVLFVLSFVHNQQPVSMNARQITLDYWAAAITFIFITGVICRGQYRA